MISKKHTNKGKTMILMISGTSDGRQIGMKLAQNGYKLLMTAVSSYGGHRLPKHENITPIVKALSTEDMMKVVIENNVNLILDATHPFAVEASVNSMEAAKQSGIQYLRYERPDIKTQEDDDILYFDSYEHAADWLVGTEGNIFLTIGSRRLQYFIREGMTERLVARLLPMTDVIKQCEDQGLLINQIIAMQGPFSKEINIAMFKMHNAKYLVTKASAKIGGFEEKIDAAREMGMTTLVIERPNLDYPNVFSDVNEAVISVGKLI